MERIARRKRAKHAKRLAQKQKKRPYSFMLWNWRTKIIKKALADGIFYPIAANLLELV
jgi:hypothetical protein